MKKTIEGYKAILNSKEAKDCKLQGATKRFFTNSCNNFLNLSEDALVKLSNSIVKHMNDISEHIKDMKAKDYINLIQLMHWKYDHTDMGLLRSNVLLIHSTVHIAHADVLIASDTKPLALEFMKILEDQIKSMESSKLLFNKESLFR